MKKTNIIIIFFLLLSILLIHCYQNDNKTGIMNNYLNQKVPDETPKIFAPNLVSTRFHEHSTPAFSPDMKNLIWYIIFTPGQRNFSPKGGNIIVTKKNGFWSKPEFFSFLKPFVDWEICFSPDGKKIFFGSVRDPNKDNDKIKTDSDIWVIQKISNGWSEPQHLGYTINTEKYEQQPSISSNGTLYYVGYWDGGKNNYGIYRSVFINGSYSLPELLPESINSIYLDWTPFIAADESYILFSSYRPGGYGEGDIYICYKGEEGSWSEAINLGEKINTENNERFPYVSPDGKYLFFIRDAFIHKESSDYHEVIEMCNNPGNGYCDIYWVEADIISKLRYSIE